MILILIMIYALMFGLRTYILYCDTKVNPIIFNEYTLNSYIVFMVNSVLIYCLPSSWFLIINIISYNLYSKYLNVMQKQWEKMDKIIIVPSSKIYLEDIINCLNHIQNNNFKNMISVINLFINITTVIYIAGYVLFIYISYCNRNIYSCFMFAAILFKYLFVSVSVKIYTYFKLRVEKQIVKNMKLWVLNMNNNNYM